MFLLGFVQLFSEKMADEYLESIMSQLSQLDVVKLGKLIEKFQIPTSEGKKGKKGAMESVVVRHINRDELDNNGDQAEEELR